MNDWRNSMQNKHHNFKIVTGSPCSTPDFHRWTKYGSVAVNCEKKDGYLYVLAFVSELASCFCLCTLKGKHWNATANGTGCNFPINSLLLVDEIINYLVSSTNYNLGNM